MYVKNHNFQVHLSNKISCFQLLFLWCRIFLGGIIAEGNDRGLIELHPSPYNVVLEDSTFKGQIKIGLKFEVYVSIFLSKVQCAFVFLVWFPKVVNIWFRHWFYYGVSQVLGQTSHVVITDKCCFVCRKKGTRKPKKKVCRLWKQGMIFIEVCLEFWRYHGGEYFFRTVNIEVILEIWNHIYTFRKMV